MSANSQQERWIDLGGLRCRAAANGDLKEIRPLDANGSITISALRKLRRTDVLNALDPNRDERTRLERNAALYGRRREQRQREDLIAMIAIVYEEFESGGSSTPSQDVYNWIVKMRAIETSDDWPWPDTTIGRDYTQSGVRTLIRQARAVDFHGRRFLRERDEPQAECSEACRRWIDQFDDWVVNGRDIGDPRPTLSDDLRQELEDVLARAATSDYSAQATLDLANNRHF